MPNTMPCFVVYSAKHWMSEYSLCFSFTAFPLTPGKQLKRSMLPLS